jgi:cytoskeletal protein CcmA (bactofilin family)
VSAVSAEISGPVNVSGTLAVNAGAALTVTGNVSAATFNVGGVSADVSGTVTAAAVAVNGGAALTVGGDVTANAFNVNSGSAAIASLMGSGTAPSALVAEGQTMSTDAALKNLSSLTVNGTLRTSQTTRSTIDTASLSIGTNGQLDIKDGFLAINYEGASPINQVAAWIASGFNLTAWNGPGIISSTAAADPTIYAVGWAEAIDLVPWEYVMFGPGNPFGDFENIDDTTILVRYTLIGDVNLDGIVDDIDISLLTSNYNSPGTWSWFGGDEFLYDGAVDDSDVGFQANNYLSTVGEVGGVGGLGDLSAMPEPATLGLLALGGLGLLLRRRRR